MEHERKNLIRFDWRLLMPDKAKVADALQCKLNSPVRGEVDTLYDILTEAVELHVEPTGWFRRVTVFSQLSLPLLRDWPEQYACAVSLGGRIDKEISKHFAAGRYLEGMVLDAMATQMLFKLSEEIYKLVVSDATAAGSGLTCRLSPGETDGLGVAVQADIAKLAREDCGFEITVTEGLMLDPVKSLAYLYGAKVGAAMSGTDHDCSLCGRRDCFMRRGTNDSPRVMLTVESGDKRDTIETRSGASLLELLQGWRHHIHFPCGGRGICGKCKVRVLSGMLCVKATENESDKMVAAGGEALACRSIVIEDCTVEIGLLAETNFVGTLDFEISVEDTMDTGIETLKFQAPEEVWSSGKSATSIICDGLGRHLLFSTRSLRQLSVWVGESLRQSFVAPGPDKPLFLTVRGERVVCVRTDKSTPVYGIGVDIGTTTLAFALIDLTSGVLCNTLSILNSQRQFGSDVVSRIQKASEGSLGALQECIRKDISRGIAELCGEEADAVVSMVIAGNTTMLHLLLGLRSDSLAHFPFNPVTMDLMEFASAEMLGTALVDREVKLLPSVGAYMGADIVAGLMYCKMDREPGIALFVDVGTNGEMAIGGKDRILCVSTAAGPAFEGANISWGTGSVPGAISKFDLHEDRVEFHTIGEALPIGICGSAVVDIVAACLRNNRIDLTGRFVSDETGQEGLRIVQNARGEWISFTQKDVREFQLAKSAIRSGLEILLREYGCKWCDIGRVYLAGGFGTKIDVESAITVGMFPEELRHKVQSVGNSALGGTVRYLLSAESRTAVGLLARSMTVIDLSKHPDFNDLFMEQLQFT